MTQMVKIGNKNFKQPHIDFLDRARAEKLAPILKQVQESSDPTEMYDLAIFLMPDAPKAGINKLLIGDIKRILTRAGVAQFPDVQTPESQITVGESEASSDS